MGIIQNNGIDRNDVLAVFTMYTFLWRKYLFFLRDEDLAIILTNMA